MTDLDPLSILAAFGAADNTMFAPGDIVSSVLTVVVLVLCYYLEAFFVGTQFALLKVREGHIDADLIGVVPRRNKVIAKKIIRQGELYLSVCQAGSSLAVLALGFFMAPFAFKLVAPVLKSLGFTYSVYWGALVISFICFVFLHIVVVQLISRTCAVAQPGKKVLSSGVKLRYFRALFKYTGITWLTGASAHFVMKYVLGLDPQAVSCTNHSTDDLVLMVDESERSQELTPQEAEISKNALELNDMCVKDIMTPRTEVDVMNIYEPFEKNWALARDSRHTRFPLVEGAHLDDVKGWVHVKDILCLVGHEQPDLMTVKRELKVVPDTMPLDSLLSFFLKEHAHFALVVDEFGDSIGLVFLDDVLEQIVGDDIQDEFDQEEVHDFVKTAPGRYAVNGTITLIDLADYLPDLDLDCPGVTTLGGYIISQLGYIPEEGVELQIEDYMAVVAGSDGRRITQVLLTYLGNDNQE